MNKYQIKQIIPITNPLFAVFIYRKPDDGYTRSCQPCHCLALVDHDDGCQTIEGVIRADDIGLCLASTDDGFQGYVETTAQAPIFPFPP